MYTQHMSHVPAAVLSVAVPTTVLSVAVPPAVLSVAVSAAMLSVAVPAAGRAGADAVALQEQAPGDGHAAAEQLEGAVGSAALPGALKVPAAGGI